MIVEQVTEADDMIEQTEILADDMSDGLETVTDIGETKHHDTRRNWSPSSSWYWMRDFVHLPGSFEMVLELAGQQLYLIITIMIFFQYNYNSIKVNKCLKDTSLK